MERRGIASMAMGLVMVGLSQVAAAAPTQLTRGEFLDAVVGTTGAVETFDHFTEGICPSVIPLANGVYSAAAPWVYSAGLGNRAPRHARLLRSIGSLLQAREESSADGFDALLRTGNDALEAGGEDERRLVLVPGAEATSAITARLGSLGLDEAGFVHFHPASRWRFKCWPAERCAALVAPQHSRVAPRYFDRYGGFRARPHARRARRAPAQPGRSSIFRQAPSGPQPRRPWPRRGG